MKPKTLADKLHGIDLSDIPRSLQDEAERGGLVVVYGASNETIKFTGVIEGEADCVEGCAIHFDAAGVLPDADDVPDLELQGYYDRKRFSFLVDANWMKDGFVWSFTTAIPHSRFVVTRDGERYCRGIVFGIESLGVAL